MNPDPEALGGEPSIVEGESSFNEVEVQRGVQNDFVVVQEARRKPYAEDDTSDSVETAGEEKNFLVEEILVPQVEIGGGDANDALREVERPSKVASRDKEEQADPSLDHEQVDGKPYAEDTTGSVETAGGVCAQAIPVPQVETGGGEANDAIREVQRPEEGASSDKEEQADPSLDHEGQIYGKPYAEDTSSSVETAGEVYVQAIPVPAMETGGAEANDAIREVGCSAEEASSGKEEHEVRAWHEYRKFGGTTSVVSPRLYDQPDTIPNEKASPRTPGNPRCPWRPSEKLALRAGSKGARGTKADGQKSIKKKVARRMTRVSTKTRISNSRRKKTVAEKNRGVHKPVTIDRRWVESLVGLRLKVPGIWWNGCTDKTLYAGRIARINFSDETERYFILTLDTGGSYPMRYDAVRKYADKELPEKLPAAESQSASRSVDGGGLLEVDRQEKEQSTAEAEERSDLDERIREKIDEDRLAVRAAQTQQGETPRKSPPGPDWTSKCVNNAGKSRFHWVSPTRRIEFKRLTAACQFEKLREMHVHDEVKAWKEYRSNGGKTFVVAPHQYDQPRTTPSETTPSRKMHSSFNSPEKPLVDLTDKRKRREEPDQLVSQANKSQKTSRVAAKQPPNATIKLRSKNSPTNISTEQSTNSDSSNVASRSYLLQSPFLSCSQPALNNGLNCSYIKINRLKETKKPSFFEDRFRGRILRVESSLSDETLPEKSVMYDGKKYFLASAKLTKGKMGGRSRQFPEEKKIEHMYVRVNGLQKELEKLCCFGSLEPEKVVARLAHLQSEAKKIVYIDSLKIEVQIIEEKGHEGCGFFPEGCFSAGKTKANYDSIQVRIIGPTIGLAKGMLLKKRGIDCIQLPRSMIKAPRSETCGESWAAVIIKNEFPSEENNQMGRFLDPDAENANNSWMVNDRRKPLSKMHQRMLIGYGVKVSDVNAYTRSAKNPKHLKHAHLKGCIDPTGCLPPKTVFISGYTADNNNKRVLFGKVHPKVYLSRSPSLEPTDAKLVSVIGRKPNEMREDDWNMLCSYKFGTIIFPRSKEGSTPLPNVIADGDLDGDDYFVMWDKIILERLIHNSDEFTSKARRQLSKLELPAGIEKGVVKQTKFAKTSDSKWLSKAQEKMLDFPQQRAATQLVGKLWSLCGKASDGPRGAVDLCNKDAIAYAKAYKESMDIQKHGGRINLLQRLHDNLPKSLRNLLASHYIGGPISSAKSIRSGPRQRQKSTEHITHPNVDELGDESSMSDGDSSGIGSEAGGEPKETSPPVLMRSRINLHKKPRVDPGKRKRGQEQDKLDSKTMKLQKTSHATPQNLLQRRSSGDQSLPGPGWKRRQVMEVAGSSVLTTYWLPPSKRFGFRSKKNAWDLEDLRKEYQGDEDKALAELKSSATSTVKIKWFSQPGQKRKRAAGAMGQRGMASLPPGPDWTSRLVEYSTQNRIHWLSPIRRIEFIKYQAACQFENLRKVHDDDEIDAWEEYRKTFSKTFVVAAHQYD